MAKELTLANGTPGASGLTVRVKRIAGAPLVAARAWLPGGSLLEPSAGSSLLTGRMLAEGSQQRSWQDIAIDAENCGMFLQSFGAVETIGVAIDALAQDCDLALDWLAELALQPSFPADRLTWLSRQAAAELEGMLDQPDYRTARAFLSGLYGDHPYSRPLQGNAEALLSCQPDDCRRLHQATVARGGCLVVTGDIDEDAVRSRLGNLFSTHLAAGPIDSKAVADSLPAAPAWISGQRREIQAGEADQAHLYLGHLTVPRNHPDLAALEVAAIILGAGAGVAGRLPLRIREKEGLAYATDVAVAAGAGLAPGRLVAYVGTAPDKVERAERAVREELTRFVEDGVSDEEFDEARSFLIGREPFRRETLRQWADLMAEAVFYGLPSDDPAWSLERLQALKRSDVEAAVRRWIQPNALNVTVGWPDS